MRHPEWQNWRISCGQCSRWSAQGQHWSVPMLLINIPAPHLCFSSVEVPFLGGAFARVMHSSLMLMFCMLSSYTKQAGNCLLLNENCQMFPHIIPCPALPGSAVFSIQEATQGYSTQILNGLELPVHHKNKPTKCGTNGIFFLTVFAQHRFISIHLCGYFAPFGCNAVNTLIYHKEPLSHSAENQENELDTRAAQNFGQSCTKVQQKLLREILLQLVIKCMFIIYRHMYIGKK